ncbi:MAG: hypothetical protein H0X45_13430, partial [Planctomycetes bacterium]|nr:hypothetical protein [Planctomycetota bacterium]
MAPPPITGTQVGKPNQQERHAALEAEFDALDHVPRQSAADAGARLRQALGDAPPLIAIETTFSLLRGTASPARWGEALASLYREGAGPRIDRRGSNRRPSHLQGTGSVLAAMGALRLDDPAQAVAVATPPAGDRASD